MEEPEKKPLTDALTTDPRTLLFPSLADLYLERGMVDEAVELCLSGLKAHPHSVAGHLVLGKAYARKEDSGLARGEFERVLSLDPQNEDAKTQLAQLESKPEEDKPPRKLAEVVTELTRVEGVLGGLILADGGEVIARSLPPSRDAQTTGRSLEYVFSLAKKALADHGLGDLRSAVMQMERETAYIFKAGGSVLALLTEASMPTGLVMLELRRVLPKIEALLPRR